MLEYPGSGIRIERHRHHTGYAALILAGGYVEAGDAGRFSMGPGDVLFHDRFEAHQDMFGSNRTILIDLPLSTMPGFARGRVADADGIARLAGRDTAAAVHLLYTSVVPDMRREHDWPDALAIDLADDRVECLAKWADANKLHPASVSRGFRLAYGVSPQRFRMEARGRRAARLLADKSSSLADIAADSGFADQAHMTRAVREVTGTTPRAFRICQAKYVQ